MKTVKALIVASAMALPMTAAPVAAQDTLSMGQSMLVGSLVNSLTRMGIPTDNINNLTLSQIAEIRFILEEDMATNQQAERIRSILAEAGE